MERRKIIVDCDAGTDDALALILLIAAHKLKKIDILAVTCVNGNTIVQNVVYNVFRILQACDALDIPVFKGADSELLTNKKVKRSDDVSFHGNDGFGDVYTDKPDISKLQSEHAAFALHRILSENPDEVSVVCLGPLTNIALAIKLFPEFISNVKDFYIMGGNIEGSHTTPLAEFNFHIDPESVQIVLNNNYKPLWLLPWETCLKSDITHTWRNNVFGKVNTPWIELLNKIEYGIRNSINQLTVYVPCDAILAGVVLRSDIVKDIVRYHVDIELNGDKTRGLCIFNRLMTTESNVNTIIDIDYEIVKELLLFAADPNNKSIEFLLNANQH